MTQTRSNDAAGAHLLLADVKQNATPVDATQSASLWDTGDGVAAFEIHTRLNLCDEAVIELLARVPDRIKDGFRALVIGSDDPRAFSAGASLDLFIDGVEHGDWDRIANFLQNGQEALLALRNAEFPVVAAVHGLTMGGGLELMLHADAVLAHTEVRMAFPERWSGIVPGWGGVTQVLRRLQSKYAPAIAAGRAFDVIAKAEILSAHEARAAGLLSEEDHIVAERAALLALAKRKAVDLARSYAPPQPGTIEALGADVAPQLAARWAQWPAAQAFTDTDKMAAQELAAIMCGGSCNAGTELTEHDLMRLEREAFMRLIKYPKALARMLHLRSTGRPLRPQEV